MQTSVSGKSFCIISRGLESGLLFDSHHAVELHFQESDEAPVLLAGDLVELQHLVAGESDALRKENFDLFCGLMRLSYNDKHLELVTWAEEAAQLSREQQRAFLRDASRLLRESYMLHAGINEISYLWGEELAFCSKFAPFVGSQNIEPLITEIECALAQISQNGNPTIVFTHFALSVSKMIKRL